MEFLAEHVCMARGDRENKAGSFKYRPKFRLKTLLLLNLWVVFMCERV